MIRNPIKDILVTGTIVLIATVSFIKYVKHYERKNKK